jgi:Flp pilus assembly protein TadG
VTASEGVATVRRFRRARGDEGAAAVEFALLFPIFMILAMGTITAGTAFSRQINVTQAAREASRYGSTYDIVAAGGMTQWLTAVDNALVQSVGNAANPIAGYDYRCVAIVVRTTAGTIDTARTAYKVNGGSAVTNAGTGCPSVTTPNFGGGSKIVQTVLSRDVKFFVVFANPTLHLDGVSTTPYEQSLP